MSLSLPACNAKSQTLGSQELQSNLADLAQAATIQEAMTSIIAQLQVGCRLEVSFSGGGERLGSPLFVHFIIKLTRERKSIVLSFYPHATPHRSVAGALFSAAIEVLEVSSFLIYTAFSLTYLSPVPLIHPLPYFKGSFPIRWTAPECMESMKFNELSDVWSFGTHTR